MTRRYLPSRRRGCLRIGSELVSKELVWDKDHPDEPFTVRDCYEFTHSCNNYAACRRYPNPLEPESTEKFIEVTHRRYKDELGEELYNKIEAFFTDEPSMMAVNLGQIPEDARRRVRRSTRSGPEKKNLPMRPGAPRKAIKIVGRKCALFSLFTVNRCSCTVGMALSRLYPRYFGAIRAGGVPGPPLSSGHRSGDVTGCSVDAMCDLKCRCWLDSNSDPAFGVFRLDGRGVSLFGHR